MSCVYLSVQVRSLETRMRCVTESEEAAATIGFSKFTLNV